MGACNSKDTGASASSTTHSAGGPNQSAPAASGPKTPAKATQAEQAPEVQKTKSEDMDPNMKSTDVESRERTIQIHSKAKAKRAQNVFAEPLDMSEDFVVPNFPKSDAAVQFIDESLADNFIFASLTPEERRLLIDAMKADSVPAGTIIIQQGEVGDYFYVVEDGNISFAVDGNHVGACARGASFGELALLYNCPRAATCIANTDCKLWKVDQRTFRYMLANNNASQQKDVLDVLRKVQFLANLVAENGGSGIKIISKIENQEGLENYLDILRVTDGVMVARGDLGMEIPPEKVFLAQKYMIREANIAGKPVVTATQMLESMIKNPRPTRAECSDVANACYDGTDAVMLSGETANGCYFRQAVEIMANTCSEAESSINFNEMYQSVRNSVKKRYQLSTSESLASSAVKTSVDVGAKCIVVYSESGATARHVAKFRPGMPVAVLTPSARVARQCFGTMKGCYAYVVDSLEDTERLNEEVMRECRIAGIAKVGDPVVIVCGTNYGKGTTNQIKVEYLQNDPRQTYVRPHLDKNSAEFNGCTIS